MFSNLLIEKIETTERDWRRAAFAAQRVVGRIIQFYMLRPT
jgi:hypothetical protein